MKNIIMLKILTILLLFVMSANVYASAFLFFPIKEVSKLKCKYKDFNNLSNDCKRQLPILKTKDYNKYKNNSTYRNYYTVLHGATYKNGWDPSKGAHLGLDIASAKGTPVYSMAAGKVIVAGYKYGRGNIISIEHKINGKKIFSNYAHLSKILVKVGDKLRAGKEIGKVGTTGASTGNHLHFQIDITDKTRHPYRYAECSGERNVVNRGLCRDGLLSNTIDPLLFIESNGTILKNKISNISNKNIINKKNNITKKDNITKKIAKKVIEKKVIKAKKIAKKVQIKKITKSKRNKIKDFLKEYKIKISGLNVNKKIAIGEEQKIKLSIIDKKSGLKYHGKIPDNLSIFSSKKYLNISIKNIKDINKTIKIKGLKKGKDSIYIKIGNIFGKTIKIEVFDKNEKVKIKSAKLVTKDNISIGSSDIGGIVMLDKYGKTLIRTPYIGKFKLSGNNDLEFCQFGKCNDGLKNEIIFEYKDTNNGILLFKYNAKSLGRHKIKIEQIDKNTKYHNSEKTLLAKYIKGITPKDLTKSNAYYKEIVLLLEQGILNVKKGHFGKNENLNNYEANIWIKKTLEKMKETEINPIILKKIDKKLFLLKKEKNSKKILTRKDFLEKINNFLIIKENNNKISLNYKDLNEKENKLANIIFDKRNTFKERNSRKYYKPEAKINKSEGAFMIKRAISVNKDFLITLR